MRPSNAHLGTSVGFRTGSPDGADTFCRPLHPAGGGGGGQREKASREMVYVILSLLPCTPRLSHEPHLAPGGVEQNT